MNNETYTINDAVYVRIRKVTARELHSDGEQIYLLASNLNPYSEWVQFSELKPTEDFDTGCNAYEYYNCNAESGWVIKFFKKV